MAASRQVSRQSSPNRSKWNSRPPATTGGANPTPSWNYQWFTFGLTDLGFVALIWLDRHSQGGRAVFPIMLLVFVIVQLPALLGLTNALLWQAFARWFASLQLT